MEGANQMEDNVVALENLQKYENYKEQSKRLKRALEYGFNLEAIFIEYAIFEDRTESVLRHAGLWDAYIKSRKGHGTTIDSKIRYIQKFAENKKDLLHKYFSDDLLDEILAWKEERNRLIHALVKQQLQHNEISELAENGNKLLKALKLRTGNYNKAIERRKSKELSK